MELPERLKILKWNAEGILRLLDEYAEGGGTSSWWIMLAARMKEISDFYTGEHKDGLPKAGR